MDRIDKLGERPQRVAVLRALRGLGDFLVAVPALRALRAALPHANITLIGLPSTRPIVQRFSSAFLGPVPLGATAGLPVDSQTEGAPGDGARGNGHRSQLPAIPHGSGPSLLVGETGAGAPRGYLDQLLEFPGFPGIPEVPFNLSTFKNWLISAPVYGPHAGRFDLAIQMHGNGLVVNSFIAMLGAPFNAGFYLPGFYCPDPERFLPWPSTEPEVWRLLRLMEFLGVPLKGDHLEFPLLPGDWDAFAAIPEARDLALRQYAVLHPGAHDPARRWPPEYFARVADALSARGLQVVLSGTAAEAEAAAAVAEHSKADVINLAGRTGLGAMAVLLSQARLLVSNDTGVSHLAAALRVPSVIIFIASDPLRWAPADRRLHRPVRAGVPQNLTLGFNGYPAEPLPCDRRCLRDACHCRFGQDDSRGAVPEIDAVLAEAFALLGSTGGPGGGGGDAPTDAVSYQGVVYGS